MKTVVVLSGGMDSTTLLYDVVKQGDEVAAISFDYGQRHKKELEMAKDTCDSLGISHKVIDISFLHDLLPSALTHDEEVPEGHYADESMKKTVVPFRNTILSSIAMGFAAGMNFERIALGVHAGDHAIYPDCRPEFIDALQRLAGLGDYNKLDVFAPFLHHTKGDIVRLGVDLGVDFSKTWTCYKGEDLACGRCGSCVERLEAFKFADGVDPLPYVDDVNLPVEEPIVEEEQAE